MLLLITLTFTGVIAFGYLVVKVFSKLLDDKSGDK